MDDNLLRIFIAVTAGAVLLQALILAALYYSVRKSTAKMEALAEEIKGKALPAIDTMQRFIVETRPKVDAITTNVA
jgi:hypothetical protein